MNFCKVVKIVCELNSALESKLNKILQEIGIANYHSQNARSVVYREKRQFFGLSTKLVMEEDPSTIYSFYIAEQYEEKVLREIGYRLNMNVAGSGSIWSEKAEIAGNDRFINSSLNEGSFTAPSNVILGKKLVAMDIIVQRGLSEEIVKAALDLGMSVPCIFYGIGTGFRDTIGILRITIPAEKEIVRVVVPHVEAEGAMNRLIDVGHLDKPGKGFIYTYDVSLGIIDTKLFRGKTLNVASMEQVIAAIDSLKGNVEWRQKEASYTSSNSNRKFLTNMRNLSIFNDEGAYEQLVTTARSNGASGATTSIEKFHAGTEDAKIISPSRERSDFCVGNDAWENLSAKIAEEALFKNNENGFFELKKVTKACTYLG